MHPRLLGLREDVDVRAGKPLEQLCRYIARKALSDDRVQLNAAAQVELELKTPWRDGTTTLVMSPLEFMQRLAALVLRLRLRSRTQGPKDLPKSAQRDGTVAIQALQPARRSVPSSSRVCRACCRGVWNNLCSGSAGARPSRAQGWDA